MPEHNHLALNPVRVAFASGGQGPNRALVERMAGEASELPLVVVAEFAPPAGEWIPWHVQRSYQTNLDSVRAALGERVIGSAAMILSHDVPHRDLRRAARELEPQVSAFDESLRPVTRARHQVRKVVRAVTSERSKKWLRRLVRPVDAEIPVRARLAQALGRRLRPPSSAVPAPVPAALPDGVSVVIPSRDGRELLAVLLPLLESGPALEVIVSDNGSSDGSAAWIATHFPAVRTIVSPKPLSFARAVNAGIEAARFNRVLLLNNDMVPEPGFIGALLDPFLTVPDLFCTTAQIFFPPGIRREETGKAVWRKDGPLDFPLRCDDPIPGEDQTWVLYGSGGCSLFDTAKLRALGGVNALYDPAYVEDLDFGYQAWKRGWPTVFCAGARVEHRHRATTSRFYTPKQLDAFVEINYLRFLATAVGDADLFRRLWAEAIRRLQLIGQLDALRNVPKPGPLPPVPTGVLTESEILALGTGDVAMFPGRAARTNPIAPTTVIIASPYLPFPLSHGGAVRMYNLMKNANAGLILISFCDELAPPAQELLDICRAVILVKRHGSHYRRETERPDTVEEFDSETFRAALKQAIRQWNPVAVQLEFTQMAQYAGACSPARTILVEHDITLDLQEQLLARNPADWELARQLERWRRFETAAWGQVDAVVTMSEKDSARITGAKEVVSLPNGVDTERFRPRNETPEPRRLLFIGSFAHLPNVLALEFFLREVWPLLDSGYCLHVIAGTRLDLGPKIDDPRIEVEGFVSDVRDAYARAEQVLAPLTASAGTNIKVLEAMAMGRVVVSTPAGINGLPLSPGTDVLVVETAAAMARTIKQVSGDTEMRHRIEAAARETALGYGWERIARKGNLLHAKRPD